MLHEPGESASSRGCDGISKKMACPGAKMIQLLPPDKPDVGANFK